MSYQKKSVKQMVEDIHQSKVYLPALQRKFVWGKKQIELLFDSLMRNYPFGTFLFWKLNGNDAQKYVFYEFLRDYDDRHPYNRRHIGAFSYGEITGVLDGQQRLSSLFVGLMGTHTEKEKHKRKSNQNAYIKTALYLNLLSLPYRMNSEDGLETQEDRNFEFRFLSEEGAMTACRKPDEQDAPVGTTEPMYWMRVSDVLAWGEDPEYDLILEKILVSCKDELQIQAIKQSKRFILKALRDLHKRLFDDQLINYFEVAKDDLEDILKIFVRVNSGGTVLSKTDLLFSTIVATWDDGRDQIEDLLKEINKKGDHFDFGTEYLMRCCLVLTDAPVTYKVDSFRSENVEKIRREWKRIAKTINSTVDLLVEFGFSGSMLTSQNATLPIAYYLYKGGDTSKSSKDGMRKYLVHALLNGIYGGSPDQIISAFRNALRMPDGNGRFEGKMKHFSFDEILKIRLPQQKSLVVSEEDVERLLDTKKGATSFWLLSLLYPHLRLEEISFHQDHIHPAARFTDKTFKEIGISPDGAADWVDRRDRLPNIQLLEGKENSAKNKTPFNKWISDTFPSEAARESFARLNFLPDEVNLDFSNFIDFYDQRKALLRMELKRVLAVGEVPVAPETEWLGRDDEIDPTETELEEVIA